MTLLDSLRVRVKGSGACVSITVSDPSIHSYGFIINGQSYVSDGVDQGSCYSYELMSKTIEMYEVYQDADTYLMKFKFSDQTIKFSHQPFNTQIIDDHTSKIEHLEGIVVQSLIDKISQLSDEIQSLKKEFGQYRDYVSKYARSYDLLWNHRTFTVDQYGKQSTTRNLHEHNQIDGSCTIHIPDLKEEADYLEFYISGTFDIAKMFSTVKKTDSENEEICSQITSGHGEMRPSGVHRVHLDPTKKTRHLNGNIRLVLQTSRGYNACTIGHFKLFKKL